MAIAELNFCTHTFMYTKYIPQTILWFCHCLPDGSASVSCNFLMCLSQKIRSWFIETLLADDIV